jgi:hypothetical protein
MTLAGMVLLRCGDKEEHFDLVDGKVHLPTVEQYFELKKIKLNGRVYPASDGLTFATFDDASFIDVTGEPAGKRALFPSFV